MLVLLTAKHCSQNVELMKDEEEFNVPSKDDPCRLLRYPQILDIPPEFSSPENNLYTIRVAENVVVSDFIFRKIS